MKPIYEKYARLRDDKGVTDSAVSDATGIFKSALSSWKHGVYCPKVDKLMLLAEFFDVDVTYFLTEET